LKRETWENPASKKQIKSALSQGTYALNLKMGLSIYRGAKMYKIIDVIPNIIANATVMRKRFLSMRVLPEKVLGSPPPKAEDKPVPLPDWSKMMTMSAKQTMM